MDRNKLNEIIDEMLSAIKNSDWDERIVRDEKDMAIERIKLLGDR